MHQVICFNLVQLMKNETIQWLQQLQQSQQNEIIILVVANSRKTLASRRKDDAKICRQNRDNMIQAHSRLQALIDTRSKQKSAHSLLHTGTSYHIFRRIIPITSYSYKRKMKKLSLLKVQRKNIKLFSPSWKRIAL